jgi:hypothetical protein
MATDMKVKGAKGWSYGYGDSLYKTFGPITARVSRPWDYKNPRPTEYHAYLIAGNGTVDLTSEPIVILISELGVEYFDDDCEKKACKAAEKKIKALIRSWAR